MAKQICDITSIGPASDLGSFIRSFEFQFFTGCLPVQPVINDGLLFGDLNDQNNCNLCPQDLPFFNIVNNSDRIHFQFQQLDNLNGQNPQVPFTYGWNDPNLGNPIFAKGSIYDCCTDEVVNEFIIDAASEYYVGLYEVKNFEGVSTYNNIQAITIDPLLVGSDCFYIKFEFRNVDDTGFDVFYSEPFIKNTCNDSTVLIEGKYTDGAIDDFGYFYGLPVVVDANGTAFKYSNKYRVRGEVEQEGNEIQKEFVNNVTRPTRSQRCRNYALRLYPVPLYAANKLSNNMNGKEICLNDSPGFELTATIEKNRNVGKYWIIDTELQRCGNFNDFSCDC